MLKFRSFGVFAQHGGQWSRGELADGRIVEIRCQYAGGQVVVPTELSEEQIAADAERLAAIKAERAAFDAGQRRYAARRNYRESMDARG